MNSAVILSFTQSLTGQAFFQYVGNSAAQNGVPSTPDNNQLAMYANLAAIGLTTSGYTPPSHPRPPPYWPSQEIRARPPEN